jgi:hypothetical protein
VVNINTHRHGHSSNGVKIHFILCDPDEVFVHNFLAETDS